MSDLTMITFSWIQLAKHSVEYNLQSYDYIQLDTTGISLITFSQICLV